MKRKLLKLILLCISVFIYTLAGAQENFGDPIDIGVVNGVYECGAIYSHSDNSCNYVDDVAGTNGAPDVVYQFELTADATVLMSMCNGTSYDSYLYLFDGSETLVTSNDDACGVYSEIEASITAGTYYVVVDGFSTSCGSYTLEVSIAGEDITPPVPQAGSLPDLLDPCMIASVVPPFADDNCVGLIVGTTETSFPIYGSTTITWSFEDLYGNISTQDQIVIIGDSDPPVPDLVSLDDVVGECNIDDPIAPTATDACGGPVTVTHDAALPIAQGTTVVTWTYEDANGNSVTQTQNFILNDLEDPTITCPPEITLETDVDACEASTTSENVYYISSAQLVGVDYNGPICNGTPDAWVCGDSFELTWNSEETNIPIGVDVEFYQSYNDNFGALPLFFNGIPDDNYEGPIESCVNNLVSVTLNPSSYNVGGLNSIIINSFDECLVLDQNPAWGMDVYAKVIVYTINSSIGEPIAEDNCGIEIIVNDVPPTLTLGTHTVEWMAIDQVGNFATCTQEVTVVDATPPVPDLAVLPDVMDECEVTVLIDPTATDACGGVVTVTNDAVLPINTQGTTVVTWYYEDEFGNISSQTQNIVIDDITDPIPDLAVLPDLNDPCAITSLTPPTATDNCGGMVTVTHDATLPIYGSGVITWTYDDGNGNTATQTQTVIVDDVDAPVPDLAVLDDITAECEITSLEEPTAIDACGGEVTVTNDAVLPITAQGTTVVTWTYTDDNLNSVTQTQNVILTDVTEPVPDLADLPDITADCEVTSLVDPNVTDNCGGTVIITNDAVLPITGEGTTTVVTWTYDDGNGNIATQTQNVIIEDLTPPVPDVSLGEPSNIEIVIVDLYGIADEIGWELRDASDVVIISGGPGATGTYIASSMNGPYTFIAETQGYWNDNSFSFDLSCNGTNFLSGSITGGQYLTYTDLETCGQESYYELPEYVMECGETVSAIPTATDACTGSITGITTYPLEYADLGTYTIAWDYEDGNGNTLTQIQDVIVTDLTGPVPDLAVLDPVSGSCEVTELIAPTATDNCAGAITGTTDEVFPIEATTMVEWTYDDGNGNFTIQTQLVIIEDVTAPVPDLAVLDDVSGECEVISLEEPTATDDCSAEVIVSNDAVFPITTLGTNVVTWTYEDANGNTATQTQNVIIEDNTDPVFATLEDITVSTSLASCDANLSVTNVYYIPVGQLSGFSLGTGPACGFGNEADICGASGNLSWTSIESTVPSSVVIELFQVANTWGTGNPTEFNGVAADTYDSPFDICTPTIVEINLSPDDYIVGGVNTLMISALDCIAISENPDPAWTPLSYAKVTVEVTGLPEPDVTDNCGIESLTNDLVPPLGIGDHVITWTATDFAGNSASATQNVTVADLVGPTPDVAELPDVNEPCEIISLTEPTATDNCGGVVTITSDAVLPITENTTVTWTYEDENGNITTQEQIIIIDDELPVPDELILTDIEESCSVESITYPTATDNCLGTITGVPDIAPPYNVSTTVTWTYDDGHGNNVTQTQNIIVNDMVPPAPDMPILDVLTAECSIEPVAPTATDNCSGEITGVSNTVFPIDVQGTTVIEWSYEDSNGNISYQDQTIIIEDVTPPVIEALDAIEVSTGELTCDWDDFASLVAPTATDNCGMGTVTHDLVDPLAVGTHTITWTATDAAGNVSTTTQEIEVLDLTAPVPDVAVLPDLEDNCKITSWTEPTATDGCFGTVTGVPDVSLPILESTTITWTYTDDNSNEVTQTQTVIIGHDIPPTPDVEELDDFIASCEVTSIDPPTATSECAEPIEGTTDAVFPITEQGSTIITWTYTDEFGNVATQNQYVFVMDYNDPVPDVSSLPVITVCDELTELTPPTATDDCSGSVTGVQSFGLPLTASTTLTWTYTDANGNSAVQFQSVVINTADVTVTNESPTLIANAEGATYQWLDCDDGYAPISGETNQIFVATEDGNYAVEVTQNGCTDISDCISVTNSGINISSANGINVYPNPTSGILNVELAKLDETSWKLVNVTGQVVLEGNSSDDRFSVNMENLSPGVYVLNIQQNDKVFTKRIVRK